MGLEGGVNRVLKGEEGGGKVMVSGWGEAGGRG